MRWIALLRNHSDVHRADGVPRLLYVLFVIERGRRHVIHFAVTCHPTSASVIQQLRESFRYDAAPRYLIFDRDAIFSPVVLHAVRAIGMKPRRIANLRISNWSVLPSSTTLKTAEFERRTGGGIGGTDWIAPLCDYEPPIYFRWPEYADKSGLRMVDSNPSRRMTLHPH